MALYHVLRAKYSHWRRNPHSRPDGWLNKPLYATSPRCRVQKRSGWRKSQMPWGWLDLGLLHQKLWVGSWAKLRAALLVSTHQILLRARLKTPQLFYKTDCTGQGKEVAINGEIDSISPTARCPHKDRFIWVCVSATCLQTGDCPRMGTVSDFSRVAQNPKQIERKRPLPVIASLKKKLKDEGFHTCEGF